MSEQATPYTLPAGRALMLRTCDAKMTAQHRGFVWPASGPVECDDWNPRAECGNGLHGLLWGAGDVSMLSSADDAKWLVVDVAADEIVTIGAKIKVSRGVVIFAGDRSGAIEMILAHASAEQRSACLQGTASATGECGTA